MSRYSYLRSLLNLGNKYGYINLILIIIYEIINFDFKKIYDYKFKKPLNSVSESYIPSFYYALYLLKKKIVLSDKIFVDFGCGRGRTLRYLKKDCKRVIGVEYDTDFKIHYSETEVIWGDCYDDRVIDNLLSQIKNDDENPPVILFFYHPFENKRIEEIIKKIHAKLSNIHLVFIGDINIKNLENDFKIEFQNKLLKIFKNCKLTWIF